MKMFFYFINKFKYIFLYYLIYIFVNDHKNVYKFM